MRVIPVLDVREGVAVHAKGGRRDRYGPVSSVLSARPDPLALAVAYRERLGASTCYLADLGAIAGGPFDDRLVRDLTERGLEFWVDAGIRDPADADRVLAAGAARAVAALESSPGMDALGALPARLGPDHLVFSLDLRAGRPLTDAPTLSRLTPLEIVDRVFTAGYRAVIVLDLVRVGQLGGPADGLVRAVVDRYPELSVFAGGGVRGPVDLRRLARVGCAGALVGTALHTGRITRPDIEAAAEL